MNTWGSLTLNLSMYTLIGAALLNVIAAGSQETEPSSTIIGVPSTAVSCAAEVQARLFTLSDSIPDCDANAQSWYTAILK